MEKAVSHFEKKLLKASIAVIVIFVLGFCAFGYFFLLRPLGDLEFISMFKDEANAYPGRVLPSDKIFSGQEKRNAPVPENYGGIPDIFIASGRSQAAENREQNKNFSVSLAINGEPRMVSVGFGDTLNYVIKYKNAGEDELNNLKVKINIDSVSRANKMVLDWSTISDGNKGSIVGQQLSPETRRGTIAWTSQQVSQLARLGPGEEGEIYFQINVKRFSDVAEWGTDIFEIKNSASVSALSSAGEPAEIVSESQPVTVGVEKRAEDGAGPAEGL